MTDPLTCLKSWGVPPHHHDRRLPAGHDGGDAVAGRPEGGHQRAGLDPGERLLDGGDRRDGGGGGPREGPDSSVRRSPAQRSS